MHVDFPVAYGESSHSDKKITSPGGCSGDERSVT